MAQRSPYGPGRPRVGEARTPHKRYTHDGRGRPPEIPAAVVAAVVESLARGEPIATIAKRYRVSRWSVHSILEGKLRLQDVPIVGISAEVAAAVDPALLSIARDLRLAAIRAVRRRPRLRAVVGDV